MESNIQPTVLLTDSVMTNLTQEFQFNSRHPNACWEQLDRPVSDLEIDRQIFYAMASLLDPLCNADPNPLYD